MAGWGGDWGMLMRRYVAAGIAYLLLPEVLDVQDRAWHDADGVREQRHGKLHAVDAVRQPATHLVLRFKLGRGLAPGGEEPRRHAAAFGRHAALARGAALEHGAGLADGEEVRGIAAVAASLDDDELYADVGEGQIAAVVELQLPEERHPLVPVPPAAAR